MKQNESFPTHRKYLPKIIKQFEKLFKELDHTKTDEKNSDVEIVRYLLEKHFRL